MRALINAERADAADRQLDPSELYSAGGSMKDDWLSWQISKRTIDHFGYGQVLR